MVTLTVSIGSLSPVSIVKSMLKPCVLPWGTVAPWSPLMLTDMAVAVVVGYRRTRTMSRVMRRLSMYLFLLESSLFAKSVPFMRV